MTRSRKHCAVYTRKSSEEGLEQDFNSLDAQREACTAFVASQKAEGWRPLPESYDDGGYSGGSMERPGLTRLLADIAAGKVDVVVVYKIDRLTRSLADFARIVEIFDRHEVSFVSVTQAFNTTTSMGRLTLNVLLSFAQFEREVTGERIRDKIGASKAKGMWMGGTLPLGYDLPLPGSRALVLNPEEAETVRTIFATYIELGSVHALQRRLAADGICSKHHETRGGKIVGGRPFSRGALFHILRNRTYLGMIVHKGRTHLGQHPAIIDIEVFDTVQAKLNTNARRRRAQRSKVARAALAGRVFDEDGQPMSPTFSHGRNGRLYRYYVSAPLQQGEVRPAGDHATRRLSAPALETGLEEAICRGLGVRLDDPLTHLTRVEVRRDQLHCLMPIRFLARMQSQSHSDAYAEPDLTDPSQLRLILPLIRRGQSWIVAGQKPQRSPDPVLVRALRAAHAMLARDASGRPIIEAAPETPYRRKLIRLAFLAPDLQRTILAGGHPQGLTLARLLEHPLPLDWDEQARVFGFDGMAAI